MQGFLNSITSQEWTTLAQGGLRITAILIAAWVIHHIVGRLIAAARDQINARIDDAEQSRRIATLVRVARYVTTVAIVLMTGMAVLNTMGISIAPFLAAAGVAGIAVGFGAQSLVKDYFTGIVMLIEDQVRVGDVAELGGKSGVVEAITLRYIRLRDYEGSVHYVPNGTISTVTNRSRGFAFAVVDIGIAYRESIDEAFDIMRAVGGELRADPDFSEHILEDLEIAGVNEWADSAVILRARFKTVPLEQWRVRRAYLKRLKDAFDRAGIEIPFPHLTVYAGQPKAGATPPFVLQHAPSADPVQPR
jgi:small conductance mechanosensitive channel